MIPGNCLTIRWLTNQDILQWGKAIEGIFAQTAFPYRHLLTDGIDDRFIVLDRLLASFPVLGAFIDEALVGFVWIKENHKCRAKMFLFLWGLIGKCPLSGILQSILLYKRLDVRLAADECYILLTGVLPQSRQQGIGGRLFARLVYEMKRKHKKYLKLHLDSENITAMRFYVENEFVKTIMQESKSKTVRYYLMEKRINSN